MSTVTGLTKERMLEIEAASVVSGTIDASGHLILTRHDGTTVDAGYSLVAVPDASDTQKGIVELATDAETAARTDNSIAVTPASLATTLNGLDSQITGLDSRIDTLEAKPPPDPATMGMTGEIRIWSGANAPNGWRLCDGGAISRTTYSALYAIISTLYGTGDGSTTFNVPNLKGRVPVGLDSGQTEFNTRGKIGGAKTHTLAVTEMPAHTHTDSGHKHAPGPGGSFWSTSATASVANGNWWGLRGFDAASDFTANASANLQNTGGGGAHNNLQPYTTVQYIIKL